MRSWVAVAAACLVPAAAAAQIEEVVANVGDGLVRFGYETRAGVEVCDDGVRFGDQRVSWRGGVDGASPGCRPGPAEVDVRVRDGRVVDVELVVGGASRRTPSHELGIVPAVEATAFLLSLAYSDASTGAVEDAVLPAMLAGVPEVWRDLLSLARDRDVASGVRKSALFWLGQEAADAAVIGLADVAGDRDEEQGVRNAAIFALSQRPADEGVPILMELARTGDEPETRRQAMFWLAQSDAPGVVDFFERILLGDNR